VFQAPVFDRYGCREVMMIAAECDRHRGLHVTADNLYVEVVQGGRVCEPGERGEILLTDLHNYGMPMIRYKVGDVGSWAEHTCACGRGLPLLNVVEGRTLDLIRTPSGRVISGEFFPHLLKDFASIRRYQIIQEREDTLRVRLAVDQALPEADHRLLQETITRTLGPEMRLDWEIGPDLALETGSKFRPVLSTLSKIPRSQP
jgi:phenylacetate-CoA ligase